MNQQSQYNIDRDIFVDQFKYLNLVQNQELQYVNTNEINSWKQHFGQDCNKLKENYIKKCDEVTHIQNNQFDIKQYYENDWYHNFLNEIQLCTDYTEIKNLSIKLKTFLKTLGIAQLQTESSLEKNLNDCITKRIEYKYKCINNPNIGHNAELLKQIFLKNKFKELKNLFLLLNNKRNRLRELLKQQSQQRRQAEAQAEAQRRQAEAQRRQAEDDFFLQDELDQELEKQEIEQYISESNSSDSFEEVVKKPKNRKQKSRKKHR